MFPFTDVNALFLQIIFVRKKKLYLFLIIYERSNKGQDQSAEFKVSLTSDPLLNVHLERVEEGDRS